MIAANVLALTWDGAWRWESGAESGVWSARDPLDAAHQIRALIERLRPTEVEVDGLGELAHRTLAYLLGFQVDGSSQDQEVAS